MVRKATLLPVEAKEVEWVRYTGDNSDEIRRFINDRSVGNKFYMSIEGDKEIYWKEHGVIRAGDFVVAGMGHHETLYDGITVISWKIFPRMISEEIPVYLNKYKEWLQSEEGTEEQMNPDVYENVKSMTYGELLNAISNIKDKMKDVHDTEIIERDSHYYNMLVAELDSRQRETI